MAAVKWNLVVLRLYYGHTRGACGSPELRAQRGKSVLNVIARRILKLSGRVNTLPQRQWAGTCEGGTWGRGKGV